MDVTGGMRAATAAGTAVLISGLGVTLHGIIRDDLSHSIGGTCLTLVALLTIGLVVLRRWIVDTSERERLLDEARRFADAERVRYIAAQAALENEQGRLTQDRAAERLADAARLIEERKALRAEFEEQRATLITETMEATVRMIQQRRLVASPAPSKVIQLRQPQRQRLVERERSREHGVVGP